MNGRRDNHNQSAKCRNECVFVLELVVRQVLYVEWRGRNNRHKMQLELNLKVRSNGSDPVVQLHQASLTLNEIVFVYYCRSLRDSTNFRNLGILFIRCNSTLYFTILPATNHPATFSPFHSTPQAHFFVHNELPQHPRPACVIR